MAKRKSSDDSNQALPKRARPRTTFQVARPTSTASSSTSRGNASRVIAIRQQTNGHLGQRKTRARTQTDNHFTQEADESIMTLPAWDGDPDTRDDAIPSTAPNDMVPLPKPKPKRKRKNTTSVCFIFSIDLPVFIDLLCSQN